MAEEEKGDIWARRALDGHRERKENQLLAATESANIALKGLLLLNGGAAIALLAFLANVVKEEATSAAAHKLVFRYTQQWVRWRMEQRRQLARQCSVT